MFERRMERLISNRKKKSALLLKPSRVIIPLDSSVSDLGHTEIKDKVLVSPSESQG